MESRQQKSQQLFSTNEEESENYPIRSMLALIDLLTDEVAEFISFLQLLRSKNPYYAVDRKQPNLKNRFKQTKDAVDRSLFILLIGPVSSIYSLLVISILLAAVVPTLLSTFLLFLTKLVTSKSKAARLLTMPIWFTAGLVAGTLLLGTAIGVFGLWVVTGIVTQLIDWPLENIVIPALSYGLMLPLGPFILIAHGLFRQNSCKIQSLKEQNSSPSIEVRHITLPLRSENEVQHKVKPTPKSEPVEQRVEVEQEPLKNKNMPTATPAAKQKPIEHRPFEFMFPDSSKKQSVIPAAATVRPFAFIGQQQPQLTTVIAPATKKMGKNY